MEDDAYTVSLDSKYPIENPSGRHSATETKASGASIFPKPVRRNRLIGFIEAGPDASLTASGVNDP
jgi:hypothetical protein